MSRSRTTLRSALPAALLVAGCGGSLEEEVATAVVSSALENSRTGNAGSYATAIQAPDGASCVTDAAYAAADAAARPVVGLYPAECLTKEAEGASLHADFSGCTGAFGRVELTGGVDAAFRPGADCTVHADLADSGDFTANGRPLDYEARAEIRFSEGQRTVDWHAHWAGTTRRGKDIEQSSSLVVVSDDETGCIAIDGATEGTVARFEFETSVAGLAICPEACPAAGVVEATLHGELRDRTIRVEFDGSDVAQVVGWSGREFEVDLVCAGEEPE